jgi:hypothetical protein
MFEFRAIAMSLATPGLCLLPVFWRPRRPMRAVPLLAFLLIFQAIYFHKLGTMFPAWGNVVSDTGFSMGFAVVAPIWNPWLWAALGVIGVAVFSLYVVTCAEWAWNWLTTHKQHMQHVRHIWQVRSNDPAVILYAFGVMAAVATFVVSPAHFDRYMLPLLVVLMLPSLRRMGTGNARTSHSWRWLLIIPLALFSVIGMRDYMVHASLRWQAAQQLVAQGARYNQVNAGYEWMGLYLYKDGVQYIRRTHDMSHAEHPALAILDPVYVVSNQPLDGYTQIGASPYQSWLEGGRTRYVSVLKRK